MKILSNQARCLKCNDEPFSAHRHDWKQCKCGAIFVDGGMDYVRHGFSSKDIWEDMSIKVEEEVYEQCMKEIEWAIETHRNDLGILCAVFRGLRDSGFLKGKV